MDKLRSKGRGRRRSKRRRKRKKMLRQERRRKPFIVMKMFFLPPCNNFLINYSLHAQLPLPPLFHPISCSIIHFHNTLLSPTVSFIPTGSFLCLKEGVDVDSTNFPLLHLPKGGLFRHQQSWYYYSLLQSNIVHFIHINHFRTE